MLVLGSPDLVWLSIFSLGSFSLELLTVGLHVNLSVDNLAIDEHVRDSHAILGQSASFVRANAGGGAKSLDGLKILDKHKLLGHSLGSEGQRHGHSGKEALGHISHDDTNGEH